MNLLQTEYWLPKAYLGKRKIFFKIRTCGYYSRLGSAAISEKNHFRLIFWNWILEKKSYQIAIKN